MDSIHAVGVKIIYPEVLITCGAATRSCSPEVLIPLLTINDKI